VGAVTLFGLIGLVVGVYLVLVLALGRPPTNDERTLLLASMAAAVVSALVWVPARTRVANVAGRLAGDSRPSPDDLVRAFSGRLTRSLPLDELLLQLAESLRETLDLAAAEIWTGSDGVFERAVSDPERGTGRLELTADEESVVVRAGVSGAAWAETWLPALVAERKDVVLRVAPAANGGVLLGLIVVERTAGADQLTLREEQALAEIARQVGIALNTARLDSALQATLDEVRRQADELRASRARVVQAADDERRRIERDLHDGAQARLVALAMKLRLAHDLVGSEAGEAERALGEVAVDLERTIEEVRDLAQGIYPPLLAERGLRVAISTAAARSGVPVSVEVEGSARYPEDVEAAVYFCCLEALQNAAKHAGEGARVTIRLNEEDGALSFEVVDEGVGFDPRALGRGAGLTNMADRIGAIGGRLRVESAPTAGTRLAATIPLRQHGTRPAPERERVRVLATVLFTDLVRSTELAAELGDRRWSEVLDAHHTAVRHELQSFHGREVNTTGDGFLATFEGPAEAIRCAVAISASLRELGLDVRAGVHTGECEVIGDDIGGIAVHIGARVAAAARPGEILVSSTVRDLVAGSTITFEDRGVVGLKGVPGEWRLYRVVDSSAR